MQRFVDELKKYKGLNLPMTMRLINICSELVQAEAAAAPRLAAVKERLHGYTEALEDTGALPWRQAIDLNRTLREMAEQAAKEGVTGKESMNVDVSHFKN